MSLGPLEDYSPALCEAACADQSGRNKGWTIILHNVTFVILNLNSVCVFGGMSE